MTVQIIQGDARSVPLGDGSVDLIVTSPPYWALRSYTDGGEHYDGQIGAEPTPAAYVDSLIECTREWMRVLKPTGSLWVNLGDKYAGAPSGPRTPMGDGYVRDYETQEFRSRRRAQHGVPQKSLIGLPWRYAIRCIDDLGLILRAEVIWSKPNGLPESVTDRVRRSHETWFHFTKSPRYFAAVDCVRESYNEKTAARYALGYRQTGASAAGQTANGALRKDAGGPSAPNPLGKLPGSVWEIATQPLKVPAELGIDHFAAFPMEWPRRIISGWSPSGICTACGEGRRPLKEATSIEDREGRQQHIVDLAMDGAHGPDGRGGERWKQSVRIVGEACACPDLSASIVPAVVLDPFGGTGTTALVADVLGRTGISLDMSADYCRLARWRVADPGQRAKAAQVPAPKRVEVQPDAEPNEIETLFRKVDS